jgi:hypothetical protein
MTHPSTSQDQVRRDDNDTYTRSVEPQMPVSQLSSRTSLAPSDTNRRSRTNARVVVRYSDGSLVAPVTGTAALEHSDSSDVTDEYSPDSAVSDVATSDQVMRRVLGAQPTEAPTQPGHSSDDTCPVCYGTLTTHPQLGHAVPWPTCGHMAHTACMYRAMQASNRCMLCRTPAERAVGNVTAPGSGQHGRVLGVYAEAARAWREVLEGLSNSDLRQMAISCGMSPERCDMPPETSNVTRSLDEQRHAVRQGLTDFLRHYPVSSSPNAYHDLLRYTNMSSRGLLGLARNRGLVGVCDPSRQRPALITFLMIGELDGLPQCTFSDHPISDDEDISDSESRIRLQRFSQYSSMSIRALRRQARRQGLMGNSNEGRGDRRTALIDFLVSGDLGRLPGCVMRIEGPGGGRTRGRGHGGHVSDRRGRGGRARRERSEGGRGRERGGRGAGRRVLSQRLGTAPALLRAERRAASLPGHQGARRRLDILGQEFGGDSG